MVELSTMTVELPSVHPQLVDNSAEFGLMAERMKPSLANHMELIAIPGESPSAEKNCIDARMRELNNHHKPI
jgi:hypothetical protein